MTDRLWNINEVADYLGVSINTLYAWRNREPKVGPRAIRVGKHLRYRHADVEAWLEEHSDEQ